MPGTQLKLGPFTGGMNTQSDPSSIADNELVDCVNFELDLDGSLVNRAPVQDITSGSNISVMGGKVICLGYGIFSNNRYYLIGVGPAGVGAYNGTTWSLIAAGIKTKCITQLNDKVWIVATPTSAQPGGSWNPDSGFTAVAAMPRGSSIVSYKARLWIGAGSEAPVATASRIYWSDVLPNVNVWSGTNAGFADVNQGDGQSVITIVVFNDTIIIFKNDSTYAYPYDSDPSLGAIRKLSGVVGATQDFCVVQYENVMYVYHEGWVYEIDNFVFTRINNKVPFLFEQPQEPFTNQDVYIYTLGDRLVVRYYRRVYVFGLRTRTWTRYASTLLVGYSVAAPAIGPARKNIVYYAGSVADSKATFYKVVDGVEETGAEDMQCYVITKNYDMGVSPHYKRLYWWGADVNTRNAVTGIVDTIVADYLVKWKMIEDKTWDQLDTWGQPIPGPQSIAVATPLIATSPRRSFLKFLKSLRYRQVRFTVVMTTTGIINEAPIRLYSLTAFTNAKETVVKAVS